MKKDTSWGNVADWYSAHVAGEDSYHAQVILPNILRLLDIKLGKNILDLACGSGFFSNEFHKAGASVTGIDISPELISLAKEHGAKEIRYFVASARSFPDIKSGSIDTVTLVLAIQNIREVKEMLAECYRVLTSQGRMLVVMNHPAFRIPGKSSWEWSPEGVMYRRTDGYLSESATEIAMHPGADPKVKTVSFHRPIQYYMKLMGNAGFAAKRMEEWISNKKSQKGGRQKEEDRMRLEIPLFLAIELVKAGV